MKNIPLLLFVMMLGLQAAAQDIPVGPNTRKKFKIGFQTSPSIDFFQPNTDGVDAGKARVKFGYGMMAEYAFTNNYALGFGLEHKMAGASLNFGADADVRYLNQGDKNEYRVLNRTARYDYVNIPVTLKLMTNQIGYFTYFGQFGVDLSLLVSAKAKDERQQVTATTDSTGAVVSETFADAASSEFNGIYGQSGFGNVKLRIGAGFEWNFSGNTALVVSVSYHNGFIDVMRDSNEDKVENDQGLFRYDDLRNRVPFGVNANLHHVAVNVGILF